jgi:hypothetical protein
MTCDQAQPHLSALYDAEPISTEAADHAAHCARCQDQLQQYAQTSAALRSYASQFISQPAPPRTWLQTATTPPTRWWEKANQSMRIPRLAFAALVLVLVALSSRLVLVEVHAHDDGSVVLLKLTPANGEPLSCDLSTTDPKQNACNGLAQFNNSNFVYALKSLRKDGDRVLLSLSYKVDPPGPDGYNEEVRKTLPETQLWFTPGQSLPLPNANATITGQWSDHIPVTVFGSPLLDPKPDEIRLVSPILIKDNQVAGDQHGGSASGDQGVSFYLPDQGLFTLRPTQVPNSVPAKVDLNRITFQSDNHSYLIVAGMPVTRRETLWVIHNPTYLPEDSSNRNHSFIAGGAVGKLP